MANNDAPTGLRPIRYASGAPYNGAARPYYVAGDYGTALYVGDPVVKTGTANTAEVKMPGAGVFDVGTLPTVAKTTAGDVNTDGERVTGVIVGFAASPAAGLDKQYNPANTERIAYVADDPTLVFEAQSPDAVPATTVGLNAILLYTHSGSTATGISGAEIDGGGGTSPAADASYQVRILRLINRVDNEPNAAFNKIEVMINTHSEAHGMTTNADGTLGI